MVPAEARALLIGVVVGGRPRFWSRVQEAHPVRSVRREPGERSAVAGPGDEPTVKVNGHPVRGAIRSHDGRVHRKRMARGEPVLHDEVHGPVLLRDDDPAQVAVVGGLARGHVGVAPEPRGHEIRVEGLLELPGHEAVRVNARRGGSVRARHRDALRPQPRQRLDELAEVPGALRVSPGKARTDGDRRASDGAPAQELPTLHGGSPGRLRGVGSGPNPDRSLPVRDREQSGFLGANGFSG